MNAHWRERPAHPAVSLSRAGAVNILHLAGPLDGAAAQPIRDVTEGLGDRLLIDLSAVSSVDPLGVGALLGAVRSVHERGGTVVVASASGPVMAVLSAAGVHHLAPVARSTDEGLAWLSGVSSA